LKDVLVSFRHLRYTASDCSFNPSEGDTAMPRNRMMISEYRSYELPPDFPLLVLDGESWKISPARSANLHFHNCVEIGLCREGCGKISANRQEYTCHAGDVTFIAPQVHHTTWSDPDSISLWSYLFLDAEKLIVMNDLPLAFRDLVTSGFLTFQLQSAPWASALVSEIIREMQEKEPGYRDCVRGMLMTLFSRILRFYQPSREMPATFTALMPALSWIQEHYAAEFTMEDLADRCHLSPTHFRRLFRSQLGTTPLDYLHQVRISASCGLLLNTKDSVASIAGQVGYESLSCFNRHFLRVMGMVPSRWRKAEGGQPRPSVITFTGWYRAETTEEILRRASAGDS